jgi:hypothetical protein
MSDIENIGKKILLEFLDFVRFKVENDSLSMSEYESLSKMFEGCLPLQGTADDFARFYGKTKTNVTTVIDRRMLPKPRRYVAYPFALFRKAIPDSWKK